MATNNKPKDPSNYSVDVVISTIITLLVAVVVICVGIITLLSSHGNGVAIGIGSSLIASGLVIVVLQIKGIIEERSSKQRFDEVGNALAEIYNTISEQQSATEAFLDTGIVRVYYGKSKEYIRYIYCKQAQLSKKRIDILAKDGTGFTRDIEEYLEEILSKGNVKIRFLVSDPRSDLLKWSAKEREDMYSLQIEHVLSNTSFFLRVAQREMLAQREANVHVGWYNSSPSVTISLESLQNKVNDQKGPTQVGC